MQRSEKIDPTASERLVFGGLKQNNSKRPKNRNFYFRGCNKIVDTGQMVNIYGKILNEATGILIVVGGK